MNKVLLNLIIVFVYKTRITAANARLECGYKQCPQTKDGTLNVHIIPHSHMDAGWVKTFDEYYYGTRASVSTANVQLIFHSVLSELLHDKRRKFTFSETSYFWRWWKEQRPTTRATFRTLVQEGRIEFAGGAWVQNDEATPDYLQIIDQYTWGLRKLNDTIGPCGKPKAAWQIDSYGHSKEQMSLLAQMGYDGLFIGRVDHKERDAMIDEDRLEFMWRGSDVLGKMSDIMTHTLFNLYNAPDGFCFDFLCNDEPIVDDPDNRVFNAEKRVSDFIAQIERQAKYYDNDNIMVTMGGDFTYQSAASWFINMDKLINHVNTHPANMSDINIFYSTPSCYLKSIYLFGKRDKAMHTERGDYFPYSSDTSTYWTGFYTSRPALKYLINRAHVFLQVVKQLTILARMGDSYELHLLRHAVSLAVHHDAITGTSQQHVANDLVKTLSDAMEACSKKVNQLLSYLTPTWGGSRRSKAGTQFVICHQLNISQCKDTFDTLLWDGLCINSDYLTHLRFVDDIVTQLQDWSLDDTSKVVGVGMNLDKAKFAESQDGIVVLVYNPMSTKTYQYVRLPALALHYSIRDYNDEEVEYQLIPSPSAIINMPGRSSMSIQDLYFEAENIPPIGFTAYYITPVREQMDEREYTNKAKQGINDDQQELFTYISNEYLKVSLDKSTGLLSSIQHVDGMKIDVTQNFFYYSQTQQSLQSGAYSFRPDKNRPTAVTEHVTYNSVRGNLVKEIRQRFTDWITQILRLYRGEDFLEIEWIIGPVPVGNDLGREVVTIFSTNITNRGEFFTDSNSRQMMKRTCKNDTTNQNQRKSVAACYYPISSRICIQSSNTSVQMCVLTDRAQGATSYNEGEIELMLHRRLLTDDGFGLEETLNEEAHGVGLVVKGKHRLILGAVNHEVEDLTFMERVAHAARRWQLEPWLFFTSGDKISRRKWQNVRNKRYSALRLHGLPRYIHVLTLEPWKSGSVLLRLENTLENPNRGPFKSQNIENPNDYTTSSAHITVDLRKVFLQMRIITVRETTLAANQWLDDARQMDWSTRYVYKGSDDGILPDDAVDMNEEKVNKVLDIKDSGSQEETNSPRKSRLKQDNRKSKVKNAYREYDRRKRSVNIAENIDENILNETTPKTYINNNISNNRNKTLTDKQIDRKVMNNRFLCSENRTTKNRLNSRFLYKDRSNRVLREKIPREGVYNDYSSYNKNIKIRNLKKDNSGQGFGEENHRDNDDDGITKSIYEMYYKDKPRTRALKPLLRSSEESDRQFRRREKKSRRIRLDDDEIEATTVSRRNRRRGKGAVADTPYFVMNKHKKNRNKRVRDNEYTRAVTNDESDEHGRTKEIPEVMPKFEEKNHRNYERETEESEEPDADEELEDTEIKRQPKIRRHKRTLPKPNENADARSDEEPGATEPDFTITLRPTQIRTFVIWFQTTKKSYTI